MVKLNLGCGWRNFGKDWIHIDGGDYNHLDYNNVTKLEFKDSSVDLIYASHVLEYFDREEVIPVLKEWYRVLKPKGVLRIAVPDFETMADLYHCKKINLNDILGPMFGKMKMGDKDIYHKTVYDLKSLSDLLFNIGFNKSNRYSWENYKSHRDNDDHSQSYLNPKGDKNNGVLISLNIETTK
jgi:predicted SAM-dependent methyltransferase